MINVEYLSAAQVADLIKSDVDGYVAGFTDSDRCARHVATNAEYINRCVTAASEYTEDQKSFLSVIASAADKILKQIDPITVQYGDKVPWRFAYVAGDAYEDGFPHTRLNVIFLGDVSARKNDEDYILSLVALTAHERVHIMQKAFPYAAKKLVEAYGFKTVGRRNTYRQGRANPDLDEFVYAHHRINKGEPMISEYESASPSCIMEASQTGSLEHPYELMAYQTAHDAAQALIKALGHPNSFNFETVVNWLNA